MTTYFEAIGRRKTASARVRITEAAKTQATVNDKTLADYFQVPTHQAVVLSPFKEMADEQKFTMTVLVKGGGISAQADAVRHGLSRALTLWKPELRKNLKKAGMLKRDPRAKERKKFGLKKARKAAQWAKR